MENPTRSQGKEAIRRLNLGAALTAIESRGTISRSELMDELRLSRTTTAELVVQLTELGLVTERTPPEVTRVGRPSLQVTPSARVGAFAVNPELDAINVGFVTLGGEVVIARRHVSADSPLGPEDTIDVAGRLIEQIRLELPGGTQIAGCGVAAPGQVVRDSGRVLSAPSLAWGEADIGTLLSDRVNLPVLVENNARVVMQAEARRGVARGRSDVVYIFAGAGGIGGGAISSARTVVGSAGFAGELGALRVTIEGHASTPAARGSFHQLVRRRDLLEALGHPDASDRELDHLIREAESDEFHRVAARQLQALGDVLCNVANMMDPQLIVLGGFLGSLARRFGSELEKAVNTGVVPAIAKHVEITPSSDTVEMVLSGSAQLVLDGVLRDPLGARLIAA